MESAKLRTKCFGNRKMSLGGSPAVIVGRGRSPNSRAFYEVPVVKPQSVDFLEERPRGAPGKPAVLFLVLFSFWRDERWMELPFQREQELAASLWTRASSGPVTTFYPY